MLSRYEAKHPFFSTRNPFLPMKPLRIKQFCPLSIPQVSLHFFSSATEFDRCFSISPHVKKQQQQKSPGAVREFTGLGLTKRKERKQGLLGLHVPRLGPASPGIDPACCPAVGAFSFSTKPSQRTNTSVCGFPRPASSTPTSAERTAGSRS